MASLNADLKTRIATLRHEILSYKPGKAVSCDDERVVFPDKLVVGVVDTYTYMRDIVPALRRALHGDVDPSKHAGKRQTSTEDQEEYLTGSISVIVKRSSGFQEGVVQDFVGEVGCMVLLVHPYVSKDYREWIKQIKRITDTSICEDNSTGGLGRSDTLQAGEEPPDDEFASILQQIADDLYDEAKIDSLAGQLGILHGDIQRALMTNMRFGRVTSDGTRHMLKQWRRGVSREDERIELKKALQAAKLLNLADLYLSEGEQIDAEYANEDVNDHQLSFRDETSLEQTRTKGHTDIQVLQEATASPRDWHTGDMVSKTQEDLTDGTRSQHLDQSPERSTEDLDESEVSSEEVHPGDDRSNVSSIQPSEQSPSHEMQVLPEDVSEIVPLVSYGGKSNEESTTLGKSHVGEITGEEDLVSQFVLIDTSPEKILILFLVKIIMDASQGALIL